jgi:hypothetical protein
MLSRARDGYEAADVENQLHFMDGAQAMLFRYELFDERNNKIRDIDESVISGSVAWNFNSRIRRTSRFQILEKNLSLGTYASVCLADRPVGYWRLGELSGTSALDSSPNTVTGTYTGGFTLGAAGTLTNDNNPAVIFNGVNGYVQIPYYAALGFTTFTLKARIKTTAATTQAIIDRDNATGHVFVLRTLPNGELQLVLVFASAPTTYVVFSSGVKVNDGVSHEVGATYDGAIIRLYVDGQIMKEFAETRTLNTSTAMGLGIGRSQIDNQYFSGTIDEVAIYNYALSPAQMRTHAQAASRDLAEVNYDTDRIKPWAGVRVPQAPRQLLGEFDSGIESWTGANITSLQAVSGALGGTSSTTGPTLTKTGLAFAGDRYRYLEIKMRLVSGSNSTGAIQFTTVTNPSFATSAQATFNLTADGKFRVYKLDMWAATGGDLWRANAITGLKILPTTNSAQNFEIDYIRALGAENDFCWFPLGLFLLSTPPRQSDDAGTVLREVEGYDQTLVLLDDCLTVGLTIAAGTKYTDAIAAQLTAAGITAQWQNIAPSTKTLSIDRFWQLGTPRIQVINDLLSAINYFSLWFDENGLAQGTDYISPVDAPSEYTYRDDYRSVIFPNVRQHVDTFGVPNIWVLYTGEPEQGTALRSEAQNTALSSPTSIPRRGGRKVVRPPELVEAADQTTLDAKVARLKVEDSQVYEQVEWTSPPMPFHGGNRDCYTLYYADLQIGFKYTEQEWEMNLQAGGEMKHRIKRVINV